MESMEQTLMPALPTDSDTEWRTEIIKRIENTVLAVINNISSGLLPAFYYNDRCVNFASKQSTDKFVLMMTIMSVSHRLLIMNETMTRRGLYYHLKKEPTIGLVPSQKFVNESVTDVAKLLNCPPWKLNVVSTSKGLVAGNMLIHISNDRVVNCSVPGGALIPHTIINTTSVETKAEFALVVEKDTVFHLLLQERCTDVLNCILITGKGYPDAATRTLVKYLAKKVEMPIYVLVDADPFGIEIMLCYRFGSKSLREENSVLACNKVRWLGIHPSELTALGVKVTPLTRVDLSKMTSIENRFHTIGKMAQEMKIMRKGKTDIDSLSRISTNFLTKTYLPYKIKGKCYY